MHNPIMSGGRENDEYTYMQCSVDDKTKSLFPGATNDMREYSLVTFAIEHYQI